MVDAENVVVSVFKDVELLTYDYFEVISLPITVDLLSMKTFKYPGMPLGFLIF